MIHSLSSVICISPRYFKFFSSLIQPFYSSSRIVSTIRGVVSHRHAQHLKTEEEFSSKYYPFLSKIRGSSLMPSSHNCFDCENSFHPSGAIQEYFQFDSSEPIISELFIPAFSSHSPNLTGASFKFL